MTIPEFFRTRTLAQHAGLAMIAAGIMAFVFQAWKNAKTATRFSEGSDVYIDAIGGIAPELFVAAAAVGVIALSHQNRLSSRKGLFALMALCVSFGIFASFQQISVGRSERVAEQTVNQGNLATRNAELARKQAELASIKVRPAAQIEADIRAWKARHPSVMETTAECTRPQPKPSSICRRLENLKGEFGAANRVRALEADIATLSERNESTKGRHISTGDPGAIWLASVTGWKLDSAQMAIAGFMAVVMMLVGMFGIHFGLLIYGMGHDKPDEAKSADVIRPEFSRQQPAHSTFVDDRSWAKAVLNARTG